LVVGEDDDYIGSAWLRADERPDECAEKKRRQRQLAADERCNGGAHVSGVDSWTPA
jgi:hypothetical protein